MAYIGDAFTAGSGSGSASGGGGGGMFSLAASTGQESMVLAAEAQEATSAQPAADGTG